MRVSLTADQWALYGGHKARDDAAAALNDASTRAIQRVLDAHESAQSEFFATANAWRDTGALDTEPRSVFAQLLDRAVKET